MIPFQVDGIVEQLRCSTCDLAIIEAERNESTRVPEGLNPRYRRARSSRHT